MSNLAQKASIIIPFFNEQSTLEESVTRLINEDFKKEILLINDGSTDKSKEIGQWLSTKFNNVELINNAKNNGKGFAVRKGIEIATGDVIGIYDADL